MNSTSWLVFILLVQIIHFLGTWKLYVKAGRKAWEAAIPVYNGIVLMQIINRPKWWVLLLFIPIINLLMFPIVWVETIRSFGRNNMKETWLTILSLGFYIYYINYATELNYIEDRDLKPRTNLGEWTSSILFAIVAATLVHTYVMQPYVIPTPSLEKTLLVGDFLLVSKFHYGARAPMTTVAAPMVHDTIPVLKSPSYIKKPQLPYFRLPKIQDIKRNDIVVFSWPADTVRFFRDQSNIRVDKPIDKRSNYVKRCVGIPGDSLSIIDGDIYINGKLSKMPFRSKIQEPYKIYNQKGVSSKLLLEYGVSEFIRTYKATNINQTQYEALKPYLIDARASDKGTFLYSKSEGIPPGILRPNDYVEIKERERHVSLSPQMREAIEKSGQIDSIVKHTVDKSITPISIFPHSKDYPFNQDQYGSIYIPQAGKTVALNTKVLPLYKRIIEEYEYNHLEVNGLEIKINGRVVSSYTFKQDYYWMMGDNRTNSEDSRYWGYVPADHIVGKPVFIWMSWDSNAKGLLNKIRTERVFTTVHGNDEPQSYFKYFLLFLAAYFVFDHFRKKKKAKA
ncbi:MAG: signal peptidase I [Flavobacteriaceae bacterium]|nr:signal peptidase I [Flavobacteriaceae bacterium]